MIGGENIRDWANPNADVPPWDSPSLQSRPRTRCP